MMLWLHSLVPRSQPKALGMDRKQKRCLANPHVRIINRGFDRIHREI